MPFLINTVQKTCYLLFINLSSHRSQTCVSQNCNLSPFPYPFFSPRSFITSSLSLSLLFPSISSPSLPSLFHSLAIYVPLPLSMLFFPSTSPFLSLSLYFSSFSSSLNLPSSFFSLFPYISLLLLFPSSFLFPAISLLLKHTKQINSLTHTLSA